MVTKINPTTDYSVGRWFSGKTVTPINIDYVADISAENGPLEALEFVFKQISSIATVIGYGPLYDSDTQQTIYVEGEFPDDSYDGVNVEAFEVHLEDLIQAGGATFGPNSFDLTANLVTLSAAAEGYAVMFADQTDDIA